MQELSRRLASEAAAPDYWLQPEPLFRGHIDEPPVEARSQFNTVRVRGWIFHESLKIIRLFGTCGHRDSMDEFALGDPRPDVASAHPSFQDASLSGFSGWVDVDPKFPNPVTLLVHAETEDGAVRTVLARRFWHIPSVTEDRPITGPGWGGLLRELWLLRAACSSQGIPFPPVRELFSEVRGMRTRLAMPPAVSRKMRTRATNDQAPRHVLLVTQSLDQEGAPLFLLELARWLREREGWQVSLASAQDGPLRTAFAALGAEVHIVDRHSLGSSNSIEELRQRLDDVAGAIGLEGLDLLVANTLVSWWAVLLAEQAAIPSVLYVHEGAAPRRFFDGMYHPNMKWLGGYSLHRATRTIFLCEATRHVVCGPQARENIRTAPGWIDTSAIARFLGANNRNTLRARLGIDADAIVVLNVGTLSPRKGQRIFLRGIREYLRANANPNKSHRFIMVGGKSGEFMDVVRHDIDRLDLRDIEVVMQTSNAYEFYALADLFVCTSYEESFPRVIMEAMAFGLPIVTTDVGGIPEILGPETGAIAIPPGDPAALADAMRRALDISRTDTRGMVERVSCSYDMERVLPRHVALLREAVSEGASAHRAAAFGANSSGTAIDPATEAYRRWRARNSITPDRETELRARAAQIASAVDAPRFSIIVALFDTAREHLAAMLLSVENQIYPNWELCIADDASSLPHVSEAIDRAVLAETRIKVVRRTDRGHIVGATNSALELATGSYLAFLDHDDLLSSDALLLFAEAIMTRPGAGLLYSDEDKINPRGSHYDPLFKGAWNPEMTITHNYLQHLTVVRRDLVERTGRMRTEFTGAQDFDLILRVTELVADKDVVHVPHVCYHWRAHKGSTAGGAEQKPYVFDAARKAIREACARRGHAAEPFLPEFARQRSLCMHQLRWDPGALARSPVTIVLATRGHPDRLSRCIASLQATVNWLHSRLVIVDGGPADVAGPVELSDFDHPRGTLLIRLGGASNEEKPAFVRLFNEGAAGVDTPLVLFIRDDVEAREPGWLEDMAGWISVPGVGIVGPKLIRRDGTLAEAGIAFARDSRLPVPLFAGLPASDPGYGLLPHAARNVTAVGDACMLTHLSLHRGLGGFTEGAARLAFPEVDFCLRAGEAGQRTVFTPQATLLHHESERGKGPPDEESLNAFKERHPARTELFLSGHLHQVGPQLIPGSNPP